MHAVGQALVQQGRTEEGMSLLDEAMAGAIGGEGSDPLTVAQMSCMTMVVCGSCFDLERATQWVQSLRALHRPVRMPVPVCGMPHLLRPGPVRERRLERRRGAISPTRSRCRRACSRRRTRSRPGRSPSSGSRRGGSRTRPGCCTASRGVRKPRRRSPRCTSQQGEPSAAAAVLRRRLAATSPGPARCRRGDRVARRGRDRAARQRRGHRPRTGAGRARRRRTDCRPHRRARRAPARARAGRRRRRRRVPGTWKRPSPRSSQAGIPYRAAQTRLLLARLLAGSDREVAGAEARAALSVFEDLGAGHDADAAAALMRDLGVKAARTGPKNIGRLTRREQEVLALLGEGLSNPRDRRTAVPFPQDGRASRGPHPVQARPARPGRGRRACRACRPRRPRRARRARRQRESAADR